QISVSRILANLSPAWQDKNHMRAACTPRTFRIASLWHSVLGIIRISTSADVPAPEFFYRRQLRRLSRADKENEDFNLGWRQTIRLLRFLLLGCFASALL